MKAGAVKRPRRHVFIAVPCYTGQLHRGTSKAILSDCLMLAQRGDMFELPDIPSGADIYDTRARIVAMFMASKATHLMMVDADVMWPGGLIPRLMNHDVDVVAAVYPRREDPLSFERCIRYATEDRVLRRDARTGLCEVAGVQGGALRMRRSVLELMLKKYENDPIAGLYERGEETFCALWDPYRIPGTRTKLGEDYSFCQRWRDVGGKVWIDPDVMMGHVGLKVFKGCLMEHVTAVPEQAAA